VLQETKGKKVARAQQADTDGKKAVHHRGGFTICKACFPLLFTKHCLRKANKEEMMWLKLVLASLLVTMGLGAQCPHGANSTRVVGLPMLLACFGMDQKGNEIPPEIGLMEKLTVLDLNGMPLGATKIEGHIPPEIGKLQSLRLLDLSHNRLLGNVPPEIAQLENLEVLALQRNFLEGSIPSNLSASLRFLDVNNNRMEGEVPEDLSRIETLKYLDLHENRFNGSFDASSLLQLEYLDFVDNDFTFFKSGTGMTHLRRLALASNNIKAPFPLMPDMKQLRFFSAGFNNFSETQIPENLLDLPKLTYLGTNKAGLGGTINALSNLPRLTFLRLNQNNFVGSFPPDSIQPFPKLKTAELQFNQLSSINAGIAQMSRLTSLKLRFNNLTQVESTAFPPDLELLGLASNSLPEFPQGIVNLQKLTSLDMRGNRMRGPIPDGFGPNQKSLKELYLQGNELSGPLPPLDEWNYLEFCILQNNQFQGPIPSGVDQMKNLKYMSLRNNNLSGEVPIGFGSLKDLRVLDISNNENLTGSFPFFDTETNSTLEPPLLRNLTVTNTSFVVEDDRLDKERDLFYEFLSGWGARFSFYRARGEFQDEPVPLLIQYDEETPGPIERMWLTTAYEREISLAWADPEEPNGRIIGYHIELTIDDVIRPSIFAATRGAVLRDLPVDTTILVRIAAETSAGIGPFSKVFTAKTLGECPIGFERLRCLSAECPKDFFRSREDPGCVRFCNDLDELVCEDSTVETIQLVPTYWRPTKTSLDISRCPEPSFCLPKESERRALQSGDTSSLFNSTAYCSPNHRGVFCWDCLEGYAKGADGCRECTDSEKRKDRWLLVAWFVIVGVIITAPCLVALYFARRENKSKQSSSEKKTTIHMKEFLKKVASKIRILVGFFQVFIVFSVVFNLFAAGDLQATRLENASIIFDLDVSALFNAMHIGCVVSDYNFYTILLMYTLVPLTVVLCLYVFLYFIILPVSESGFNRASVTAAWIVLNLAFFVFPGVSAKIVKVFLYKDFEDDNGESLKVLTEDYTVEYGDAGWFSFAIIMGLVYLLGVPLLFAFATHFLNHLSSGVDQEGNVMVPVLEQGNDISPRASFARAIAYMLHAYRKNRMYWECVELFRKLVMTSGFLILHQYFEEFSPIIFIIFVFASYVALKARKPYKADSDLVLAEISLGLLFAASLLPIARSLALSSMEHDAVSQGKIRKFAIAISSLMGIAALIAIAHDFQEYVRIEKEGPVRDESFPNQSQQIMEDEDDSASASGAPSEAKTNVVHSFELSDEPFAKKDQNPDEDVVQVV